MGGSNTSMDWADPLRGWPFFAEAAMVLRRGCPPSSGRPATRAGCRENGPHLAGKSDNRWPAQ